MMYPILVSQHEMENGRHRFNICINGTLLNQRTNIGAEAFEEISIYSSKPGTMPVHAYLDNMARISIKTIYILVVLGDNFSTY